MVQRSDAKIHMNEEIPHVIDQPRRIHIAIADDVQKELQRMIDLGVIFKQEESTPWVNSLTIVRKPGKIRVCLHPTKLNKAILHGPYPLRTIEEVVAKIHGAEYFSLLDANSGYWQIQLDESNSKLCTFNTPWGKFRYTRLPFGIKTAGDIFIQEMNEILQHLEGVHVISDDILIHGMTVKEHNQRLEAVLTRAREVNHKLNPRKTKICQIYLEHTITAQGLKPNPERIQAILDMQTPQIRQQCRVV